jgi:glutathione S-transferase
MKLLNSFVSPFAARVRLAIYAYDLSVEIAPSGQWGPGYQKAPEYLAINPIGLVPTLVLDDGTALPESSVIVEYLADAFPKARLRPGNAENLGRARLLAHLVERYVQMPGAPLIGQIFSGQRDPERIRSGFSAMDKGLSFLEHFIGADQLGRDHAITIADCALVPLLYFFADRMAAAFDVPAIIANHPALSAYWQGVQTHPAARKVINEMAAAIANSPIKALVTRPD